MIRTAIIYGLVDMCIDLITKPIISELDVMPNQLIGQRFDFVMATMCENEIPPFVRSRKIPISTDWGVGNIRLNDVRVTKYENGVYRFHIYDSVTYSLKFNYPDLYREYRKLYLDLGIHQASNDLHNIILIRMVGNGEWIELNKSDIVMPSALID